MHATMDISAEASAHARRFLKRSAAYPAAPTTQWFALIELLSADELKEARLRVGQFVSEQMQTAELGPADMKMLVGAAYLRLQYLLDVQDVGEDIALLLSDPVLLDERLTTAFLRIEPELFLALSDACKSALRDDTFRVATSAAVRYLRDIECRIPTFEAAGEIPAASTPWPSAKANSIVFLLSALIVVNLWPRKDNTPGPKSPADIPKEQSPDAGADAGANRR